MGSKYTPDFPENETDNIEDYDCCEEFVCTEDDLAPDSEELELTDETLAEKLSGNDMYTDIYEVLLENEDIKNRLPSVYFGTWSDEEGNSEFILNKDSIVKYCNDEYSMADICNAYGVYTIPFHNGVPDFSSLQMSDVPVLNPGLSYSADRTALHEWYYEQIDSDDTISIENCKEFIKDNSLTIHEDINGDMYMIPSLIHSCIAHNGGISVYSHIEEIADTLQADASVDDDTVHITEWLKTFENKDISL